MASVNIFSLNYSHFSDVLLGAHNRIDPVAHTSASTTYIVFKIRFVHVHSEERLGAVLLLAQPLRGRRPPLCFRNAKR